jgi:hypothetical protein
MTVGDSRLTRSIESLFSDVDGVRPVVGRVFADRGAADIPGCLELNGAAISASDYPALAAVYGVTIGDFVLDNPARIAANIRWMIYAK